MDITSIINANPIAQGGLLTVLAGGILGGIYSYSSSAWHLIKNQCISELQINSDKDYKLFEAMEFWLSLNRDKIYSKTFQPIKMSDDEDMYLSKSSLKPTFEDVSKKGIHFTLGEGTHFMFYKKHLLLINKYLSRRGEMGGSRGTGDGDKIYIQSLSMNFNTHLFSDIVSDSMVKYQDYKKDKISMYATGGYSFSDNQKKINKRKLSSVILKDNMEQEIMQDVNYFLDGKDFYTESGLIYKRTYLLYGVAGTGKSSLMKAIASELHYDIYNLSMKDLFSTEKKNNALGCIYEIPPNSIICIEDLHVFFDSEDSNKDISLLLQFLDGLATPEDCLIFLTANDISKIPEVILRPGRVDKRVYFDYCDKKQFVKIANRLFKNKYTENDLENVFLALNEKITPSTLQQKILTNLNMDLDELENILNQKENIEQKQIEG